jgi:hypothetical protein
MECSEEVIKKVTIDLIEKLKYKKIQKGYSVELFINDEWLLLDLSSQNLNTPFLKMITKEWKEETQQEALSPRDLEYIELVRGSLIDHYLQRVFQDAIGKMNREFNAKYLGDRRYELFWRERKYEITFTGRKKRLHIPQYIPSNKLYLNDIKLNLFEKEAGMLLSTLTIAKITSYYLWILYKQTTEYKLSSLYR